MCWEMDYYWLAEQKKAEEAKTKQEQQRSQAIEKLLNEANKPADKPEERAPVKERIPAK